MNISQIYSMDPGRLRREKLVDWLKGQSQFAGLPVNNKYQFIIEYDKDLQILLKKKIVKRKRVGTGYRNPGRSSGKNQTYLILTS